MAGRVAGGWMAALAIAACSGSGAAGSGGAAAGGAAGGAGAAGTGGCARADTSSGGAADASLVYPTPHYAALTKLGARVASVCFDTAALTTHATLDALAPKLFAPRGLAAVGVACPCDWTIRFDAAPPALSGDAFAALTAAGADPERYVIQSVSADGRATTDIYAPTERAGAHALYAAVALAQPDGDGQPPRVASGTLVDYPAIKTRAILEGFYGTPYSTADRATVIRLAARLEQSTYVYGPKNDAYAREQWADPYPQAQAQAIADAAKVATDHLVDFVWSVSPGLPFTAAAPGTSIKYSSDADFAKLTAKIESVRALGVTRFALFLDDINGSLVWPEDIAAFKTLPEGQATLINKLDDYLKSKDPDSRLLIVGTAYSNFWPTWDAYNTELGQRLHPDIDMMWTGPGIYSATIQASDLDAINQKLGRHVSLWDNGPKAIAPLTGRSADLVGAIDGLYSNPVVNENGKYPTSDFFKVQGTLADYAWNPAAYVPDTSFVRWQTLLAAYPAP